MAARRPKEFRNIARIDISGKKEGKTETGSSLRLTLAQIYPNNEHAPDFTGDIQRWTSTLGIPKWLYFPEELFKNY